MKSGKWIVEVRKKGYPYISKAFWDLKVARKFGRDVESQMERNVFEDYFRKLGDRFILFNEKANSEIANVIYSLKSHHSKYIPEQLVVI